MEIFKNPTLLGNLVFVSADGFAIASWLTGAGVSIFHDFLPGIYTAIILFCTGAIIAVNWQWINNLRPKTKFKLLEPLLYKIAFNAQDIPYYDIARIRELHFALKDIGIEYPLDGIDSKLRRYVTKDIWAACRNGKLNYAKTSWKRKGQPLEKINDK
ncbi:MAG: hypothetical protein OXC17_02805 [Aestuariivita sp.]|nr:hypothetical protein [Aestuariivita sp.]